MNEIIKELDKILPVVERVHGDNHPELHEVAKLYVSLKEKKDEEALKRLVEVTSNFTVPEDACPTFRKTYEDLAVFSKELA